MDLQKTVRKPSLDSLLPPFKIGDLVIYDLHGKFQIQGIEKKGRGPNAIDFYRLEPAKRAGLPPPKKETAIWVPVQDAPQKGLRRPLSSEEAPALFALLLQRESYFTWKETDNWKATQSFLEQTIRHEGAIGLAKVCHALGLFLKRAIVPPTGVPKFYEMIQKQLARELSEALGESPRVIEEKIQKSLSSNKGGGREH